uniref:UBX domain-containing protein 11 n=1 Tax=Mus musculus TaxID=10090 RepID=Q8CCM4_MOUSE|nr:unnamed protein product [Mus musculus]
MDQENSEEKTVSENDERDWMKAKKFWKPGDSFVPPEVDFDKLMASLQDLSELVEGEAQVTPVPGGARFRTLEPIPLKVYRNGIMMFDGPFRPFYDPSTQRCLRDILDGFFPSELQRLYPDGVPFKVSSSSQPTLSLCSVGESGVNSFLREIAFLRGSHPRKGPTHPGCPAGGGAGTAVRRPRGSPKLSS